MEFTGATYVLWGVVKLGRARWNENVARTGCAVHAIFFFRRLETNKETGCHFENLGIEGRFILSGRSIATQA
jgi:hypothetical protein